MVFSKEDKILIKNLREITTTKRLHCYPFC